jgi:adenosine deaminase
MTSVPAVGPTTRRTCARSCTGERPRQRRAARAVFGALAMAALVPAGLAAQDAAVQVRSLTADEEATAAHFEAIRHDPVRALLFLRAMPKGADLHSHLSGAVYAESFIEYAAEAGLCIDTSAWEFTLPPCDGAAGRPPAADARHDAALADPTIDAMSVRNWHPARTSGHEQFFGSFDRFRLVSNRTGDMLAEVASRAADGRVSYLELMITPAVGAVAALSRRVGWDPDFQRQREQLLAAGLRDSLARARQGLDAAETRQRELLGCAGPAPDPGCGVVVRYLYQGLRAQPPELVFALILAGFELAAADPRVVGLNLVQPEDHPIAMRDYSLHMRMIGALRQHYPGVGITLHAGELTAGLVPPEGLRFHIREAVEVAGATRIGHGVAVAHERDAIELIRELARRRILVEIALGSNDRILGVRGDRHPLSLYMSHGVPVALATDDEGVLRSDMTHEYLKGVREQGLGYIQLKAMARNSLEYAFVEGGSLWQDAMGLVPVGACSRAGGGLDAAACQEYVAGSTKARLQWQLERDFADVEAAYADRLR